MLPVFDGLRNITLASVAFRLILSTLCGGIVGMEREFKRRSAGFRTHILICLGAAMTTLTSEFWLVYMRYYLDAAIGAGFYEGGLLTAGLILLAELLFSKIEYHIMATAPEINLFVEYKDRSALDRVLKLYRDKLIKVSNMEITRQPDSRKNNAACALFTLRLNRHCSAGTLISDVCTTDGVLNVEEI